MTAVDVEEMKGQGAVRCLTSRSHAGRHRMLVLHEDTGVTIWDLRYLHMDLCIDKSPDAADATVMTPLLLPLK